METAENKGCPLRSVELLDFALNALTERGILGGSSDQVGLAQGFILKNVIPEWYFPDVYIDLSLTGTLSRGAAVVMDQYDRCRIDYMTEGDYFRRCAFPALTAPDNRDDLLIIHAEDEDPSYSVIHRKSHASSDDDLHELSGIESSCGLLEYVRAEETSEGIRLVLDPGTLFLEDSIERERCRNSLHAFLSGLGCRDDVLEIVDNASFFSMVPYLHPRDGYMEWMLCTEIAAIDLMLQDGRITDCHVLIRISDKSHRHPGQ